MLKVTDGDRFSRGKFKQNVHHQAELQVSDFMMHFTPSRLPSVQSAGNRYCLNHLHFLVGLHFASPL
jgi:hypothetical protein